MSLKSLTSSRTLSILSLKYYEHSYEYRLYHSCVFSNITKNTITGTRLASSIVKSLKHALSDPMFKTRYSSVVSLSSWYVRSLTQETLEHQHQHQHTGTHAAVSPPQMTTPSKSSFEVSSPDIFLTTLHLWLLCPSVRAVSTR